MSKKGKKALNERSLYVWANATFFDDEIWPFLRYCEKHFYDSADMVSEEEFKRLKAGFLGD